MDIATKKKKSYIVYSNYERMIFIIYMLAKALKKIASTAMKYNINERTGQQW